MYAVCKDGIFKSIQGEGFNSGRSAVFVRLSQCNMIPRCSFCDEKFDVWENLEAKEIVERVEKLAPFEMVVITGGEPSVHDLAELFFALKRKGYFIAIETNGLKELECEFDWITCSPKTENVKIKYADELKFVVDKNELEMLSFISKIIRMVNYKYIYLQPRSNEKCMIDKCLRMISQDARYRLSLQIHKLIGIK